VLAVLGLTLGALGLGAASALVPLVNAELAAAGIAVTADLPAAVLVALALALGQTAGKLVIFAAARRGRSRHRTGPAHPTARRDRLGWRRLGDRGLGLLDSRWRGAGIVLMSAGVGLPPLALVSAACGVARTRPSDFALCCLLGRTARFLLLVVPLAIVRP